ncbi:MAG: hypothetical protein GF317_16385 [Candidatus Lokiarchaeota archaeon]|nr:hypothetical protein [Candidatus Lokiarchaeota archaeon]MBD3201113.1 hypothetical protein [Candidatus Lokiarchaeota archaeon]
MFINFFGARDGLAFHGSGGMHGGYPHATGYRLIAKNTNMEEIIRNQDPYPIADADPNNGDFEKLLVADIIRKSHCSIYPVNLKNYDLVHFALSGGPGYGDPIERSLAAVKQDLDDEIYTSEIVENVYGVKVKYNEAKKEWIIDKEATSECRRNMIKRREEESMTFDEFWEYERTKIIENNLSEHVTRMYSESIEHSTKWKNIFYEFWKLDEDFKMEGI